MTEYSCRQSSNKHNKFDISRSTQNLAILIADSDSGWQETSKNTPPKFFPQVVVLAKIFAQIFQKIMWLC
jgi:hypothetical protein